MGGAGRSLVQNALSAGSDEDALSGAFSASLGRQSSAPWALPNPPGPQARGQKPALESTGSTQTALWHRRDLKGSPFCLPPGPSPLCLRPHPLCFLLGPELASDATTAPSRTTEDWSLLSNGCLSTLVSPVPRCGRHCSPLAASWRSLPITPGTRFSPLVLESTHRLTLVSL